MSNNVEMNASSNNIVVLEPEMCQHLIASAAILKTVMAAKKEFQGEQPPWPYCHTAKLHIQ